MSGRQSPSAKTWTALLTAALVTSAAITAFYVGLQREFLRRPADT